MNTSAATAVAAPPRRPTLTPGMVRTGVILLMLVVWEVLARLFGDPLFVSPPSKVVVAIFQILQDPGVVHALALAFWELIAGFAVSVFFGTIIGLVLGLSSFWYNAGFPVMLMLYAVPQATVLPLFILMLGVGAKTKIIFGITHAVFVVIITVAAGTRNIDVTLMRAARSMGASWRQLFINVALPSIVPSLFTAMRLAMASTLLGVLLAELYVSQAGVGLYTTNFSNAFEPAKLFALIVLLAAMAIVLNELARMAERRFSRWRG